MSKRELKKAVLRVLSAHVGDGVIDWGIVSSEEDERRLDEVLEELADEFHRRGEER